jgi:hypothetical protein
MNNYKKNMHIEPACLQNMMWYKFVYTNLSPQGEGVETIEFIDGKIEKQIISDVKDILGINYTFPKNFDYKNFDFGEMKLKIINDVGIGI